MSSHTFFLLTCHLATTLQRALALLLLVLSWVTYYPAKDIIITVQNGFMTESKAQWEISTKVQFSLDDLVKLLFNYGFGALFLGSAVIYIYL
jgi:hypothetical protein